MQDSRRQRETLGLAQTRERGWSGFLSSAVAAESRLARVIRAGSTRCELVPRAERFSSHCEVNKARRGDKETSKSLAEWPVYGRLVRCVGSHPVFRRVRVSRRGRLNSSTSGQGVLEESRTRR